MCQQQITSVYKAMASAPQHGGAMTSVHKVYAALLWQKEASDKVTFLVKEQNVSVIFTDINGISLSYVTFILAG